MKKNTSENLQTSENLKDTARLLRDYIFTLNDVEKIKDLCGIDKIQKLPEGQLPDYGSKLPATKP